MALCVHAICYTVFPFPSLNKRFYLDNIITTLEEVLQRKYSHSALGFYDPC